MEAPSLSCLPAAPVDLTVSDPARSTVRFRVNLEAIPRWIFDFFLAPVDNSVCSIFIIKIV